MRALWVCAISAIAAMVLAAAPLAACAEPARHAKPSSFEPHARAPGNAYGTPIGAQILIKRPKKKKKPASTPAHSASRVAAA
jgi:hypothetical protein